MCEPSWHEFRFHLIACSCLSFKYQQGNKDKRLADKATCWVPPDDARTQLDFGRAETNEHTDTTGPQHPRKARPERRTPTLEPDIGTVG